MPQSSDRLFVGLAVLHGAAMFAAPSAPLIGVGIWWNSNTIAHNFIHRPFFKSRLLNLIFSACQSGLMGIPQVLWRERHLAHHAGVAWRSRWSAQLVWETSLVVAVWTTFAVAAPMFFLLTYLPGYALGLLLCALQGHYEHVGAATVSHYGRIYNWLCFNDGYHVEHHACPGVHWTDLPARTRPGAPASRWPAPLRWMDAISLEALERMVLRCKWLQRLMVAVHRSAFREILAGLDPIRRVTIVGGGLFPRTAIALHDVLPGADLTVIDASAANLDAARAVVVQRGDGLRRAVVFTHGRFSIDRTPDVDADLLVVPLAFQGDRQALYANPPARVVVVHDWLWRRRGRGRVVSVLLLKRLNLVERQTIRRGGPARPPGL
jgi:hypothetical protein